MTFELIFLCNVFHRLRLVPPQDDITQNQSKEETTQRQHNSAAMFLFCGGMDKLRILKAYCEIYTFKRLCAVCVFMMLNMQL